MCVWRQCLNLKVRKRTNGKKKQLFRLNTQLSLYITVQQVNKFLVLQDGFSEKED